MKKSGTRRTGRTISATDAAKNFGRLVDRVREARAVYVIERSGRPVAQIGPAPAPGCTFRDLAAFLHERPRLDETYLTEIESGVARANRPALPEDRWGS
jgi:antitoxin (DNA-binding transcriptional repressor) of toxin-antitoxin stability system